MNRRALLPLLALGAAALLPMAPAEAAPGDAGYGVTADGRLVLFDLGDPTAPSFEDGQITGLGTGESITAIDVRPADGALYAVAIGAGGAANTYRIDADPQSATFGAASLVAPVGLPLTAAEHDIDFNPCVNALRVVGTDGSNLRITGAGLATTIADTTLAYAPGDPSTGTPRVAAAAYTPAVGTPGDPGCTTDLFDVDVVRDVLARQAPPNAGTLTTRGPLGVDVTSLLGFDVAADGTAYVAALAVDPEGVLGTRTWLLRADLATGALTPIGLIGSEILRTFAVAPTAPEVEVPGVPFALALPALALAGLAVELTRSRRNA